MANLAPYFTTFIAAFLAMPLSLILVMGSAWWVFRH